MMQLKAVNAEKVGGYSYDVTLKVHKTDLVGIDERFAGSEVR